MRQLKTSAVLGVLALALLGYVLFVERGSLSSGELDQRKGSVLPELLRDRVDKIEIQRKGQRVVLSRTRGGEDEEAVWRVESPYKAKADAEAVDSLLGALEWMQARRRMEIDKQDRKRFGLLAPRYRVWITVGNARVPLVFGKESATGDGVYAAAGDRAMAFVVGKDAVEALDHEAAHYHDKELHEGVIFGTAIRLSLRDEQGERVAEKRADGLWNLHKPAVGLASVPAISEIVTALDGLLAQRFVAQAVKDLARYGLDKPSFDLKLVATRLLPSAQKKPGAPEREEVPLRLRVGRICDGHKGERYAMVDDTGVVYCLLDADIAKLRRSLLQLREARLLPVEDEDIESLRVQRAGATLSVKKDKDGFSYEAKRPGAKPLTGEARDASVQQWLKALRAISVERFDAGSPATLGKFDLVTLRVERSGKAAFEISVDLGPGREVLAQRADEPQAVVLVPGVHELLDPSAARFRKLELLDIPQSALRSVEVRRGGEVETFDGAGAGELARLLSSLDAERFVADAPEAKHGLAAPSAVIVFSYVVGDTSAQKRMTLRLGADAEGGRYAELEGQPGVFVASAQLLAALASLRAAP